GGAAGFSAKAGAGVGAGTGTALAGDAASGFFRATGATGFTIAFWKTYSRTAQARPAPITTTSAIATSHPFRLERAGVGAGSSALTWSSSTAGSGLSGNISRNGGISGIDFEPGSCRAGGGVGARRKRPERPFGRAGNASEGALGTSGSGAKRSGETSGTSSSGGGTSGMAGRGIAFSGVGTEISTGPLAGRPIGFIANRNGASSEGNGVSFSPSGSIQDSASWKGSSGGVGFEGDRETPGVAGEGSGRAGKAGTTGGAGSEMGFASPSRSSWRRALLTRTSRGAASRPCFTFDSSSATTLRAALKSTAGSAETVFASSRTTSVTDGSIRFLFPGSRGKPLSSRLM